MKIENMIFDSILSTSTSSTLPKGIGQSDDNEQGNASENVPSIILKRHSHYMPFWSQPDFSNHSWYQNNTTWPHRRTKGSRNVNRRRYYRRNNTHVYSNNYLVTFEGWQAGWVSMTEKSRQRALFLFTTWLENLKSLSNKTFFFCLLMPLLQNINYSIHLVGVRWGHFSPRHFP